MDISHAVVEVTGLNQVRISLPPWDITARVEIVDDRPVLVDLRVLNAAGITATRLADLPIRGITMLAASTVYGTDEHIYRRLAMPLEDSRHRRPAKSGRSKPDDHYQRVAQTAQWAARSAYRGGPAEAIAEFWGVTVRTARRWLAEVSRRAEGAAATEPDPANRASASAEAD